VRWSELRAFLSVVRRECQLSRRSSAFYAIAAVGAMLALWRGTIPRATAALVAYQTEQIVVLGLGVAAVLLAGLAAARDRRQAAAELVLAKPAGSARALVPARFLAVWLSVLLVAAIMLVAASVGQLVLGDMAWQASAYADAFLRSLLPLGLACALGFSFASLFTTPLASGVAAIYWIGVPLVRPHMPVALDLTLSQHWLLCALAGGAAVALAAALYAWPVRDRSRGGAQGGWTAAVLFAAAVLAALVTVSRGDDALLEPDPTLAAIASQTGLKDRRAPGFWLPDSRGRLVGLNDFAGRPVVLAFWGPGSPTSARRLLFLEELAAEFQAQKLACIAVCLDRDAAALIPFVREVGQNVVILWDRGRHFGDSLEWSDSPVAVSYGVSEVPSVFFLDRDRRWVDEMRGEVELDDLRRALFRMLARE